MPSAILVNHEFRDSPSCPLHSCDSSAGAYYLLIGERNSGNPRCKALALWLKAEAVEVRNKLAHFEETLRGVPVPV